MIIEKKIKHDFLFKYAITILIILLIRKINNKNKFILD